MGEFGFGAHYFSAFHIIIVFTVMVLHNCCQVESKSQDSCPLEFKCGNIPQVSFPFSNKSHPDCGFLILDCDAKPSPTLEVGKDRYEVLQMGNDFTKFFDPLLNKSIQNRSCDTFSRNLAFLNTPLISSHVIRHPSVFRCNHSSENNSYFSEYESYHGCKNFTIFYMKNGSNILGLGSKLPFDCSPIQLPFKWHFNTSNEDLFARLSPSFDLTWNVTESCLDCHYKGGRCLVDNRNNFQCSKGKHKQKMIRIAVVGSIIAFISISLAVVVCVIRHGKKGELRGYSHFSTNREGIEMGIPVFSYSQLVKATNGFDSSKELGDGGFGTVYHGKLRDGREVAVKRLYEHNCKRMEQFINEIEILTGLRHTNLVTLYGCSSRSSRELLLVYEYISNGTLADHLHGKRANQGSLPWPIRLNIAVETASALAYLHASDIIHRDVKTANILLDHNFSVKVADFGLSRLFPSNVTHVSTAPQGTPGYVDPEYHECYQLTDKSDVYSFGVVLIELISSMPAVDMSRHKQEINLANFAIHKIMRGSYNELIDPSLGFERDEEIMRMTTSVAELAFRCIQLEKDMRPTMDGVVDALKEIRDGERKGEEIIPPLMESEHVVLSKSFRFPTSPISVTDKWISSSSTTNSSS
ncbi:PREDICTED: LEAF RUST 10 DISEASE-RESISTANCE LOCUS RECEPTOR-LIKE PROTEIN KINASE-like 1.1 [Ipomoea nil]|uniref:LEAF RUST 10 DISEASE-RESISTANCE LOCUS RECEPTOR-LIKE PROTEIN KINASE-like 1.1 n=1 Tax=Ipomoea nil TaxID=35883 RepID=UPI00090087E2|nr:PREDICTED: LEAF RUST 10 DISEASE-RESISTANCE LOCUS RECEPTOR-LIKE PROTEIN KINASE-like 1.1 [Ipomoea nil]